MAREHHELDKVIRSYVTQSTNVYPVRSIIQSRTSKKMSDNHTHSQTQIKYDYQTFFLILVIVIFCLI